MFHLVQPQFDLAQSTYDVAIGYCGPARRKSRVCIVLSALQYVVVLEKFDNILQFCLKCSWRDFSFNN